MKVWIIALFLAFIVSVPKVLACGGGVAYNTEYAIVFFLQTAIGKVIVISPVVIFLLVLQGLGGLDLMKDAVTGFRKNRLLR